MVGHRALSRGLKLLMWVGHSCPTPLILFLRLSLLVTLIPRKDGRPRLTLYFCPAFFSAACFCACTVHGGTIPFSRA